MKLYYSDTLAPRKVCAVAKYLDAPVEYVFVDLHKGEQRAPAYLAINPNGKVPTLVDGDCNLWEADAIICHLARRSGSDLWPRDARQSEVLRWLSWNAHHFNRYSSTLYFEHIIKPRFGLGAPDPSSVAAAQESFRGCAGVLDRHLNDRQWLLGDDLSVADFSVAVPLPYAARAAIPLDDFPAIRRWHDRLDEIAAWREPFPAAVVPARHDA